MAFLGNFVRSFMSQESPSGDEVIEVSISNFTRVSVIRREHCLVLYGPTQAKIYDLLLQKPVEDSCTTAYSLFRIRDVECAQMRFFSIKDVLLPLIQVIPHEVINISSLQKICDFLKQNPTWNVAHIAAHLGYYQAFSHPDISSKADTSEIDHHSTPLHLAVQAQDVKMIRTLLDLKVCMDIVDNKGNSVFHMAATSNEIIIKTLSSQHSKLLNAQNNAGKTPLHLACENNKPECVKALLIIGSDVNVAATHSASLPIHTAVESDSTLCAKEIIAMYPNQLYVEDMKNGGTPLHWATSREMVNALVELGCRINAGNFQESTALHNMVLHNRLQCVIALLSWGAEVNLKNEMGNTPLHLASGPAVLQALLSFGADPLICNNKGELCRHTIATSSYKKKNEMIYILHSIHAPRCSLHSATCADGCSPNRNYDGEPPEVTPMSRPRIIFDEFLDDVFSNNCSSQTLGERVLCLDGGGIKGLILIQLLRVLEKEAGMPVKLLFDWICGTSTGGILTLALALGKTSNYCQGLYFRLKDQVFIGPRPYKEEPLERILKKEFGENSHMTDIKDVRVIVTGVLADRFPADLHLFRNYVNGEDLFNARKNLGTSSSVFMPVNAPNDQLIWQAARSSGAAPSYFSAYGRFIDGGLIANNPTLDFLTEIAEYNAVLNANGKGNESKYLKAVVSLGTGRPPVSKVNAIDVFRPESLFKTIQMAFGLSNMAKLLIDQATMADNRTVDRARAWCGMCGISYLRLSPQLSSDVQLDETRDEVLVNMLWETLVYAHSKINKIRNIVQVLKSGVLIN